MRRLVLRRDAVMHDGAVRPGAGDGRERNVLEQPGVAAETFQRLDRVDLGQLAARRLAVEPGEKARHRRAVAQLRGARAGDLGRVLHRLHRRDRIGAAQHLAAVLGDEPRDRFRAGRRIEPHARAAPRRARRDRARTRRSARTSASSSSAMPHLVAELAAVDIERRPAVLRHDGEGEHQRRVRHVAAADVEQPGHRVRIGHDQRVGCSFLDLGAHARELVRRRLRRRSADRAAPRRRAAAPAGRSRSRRSDCRRPATSVAPAAAQALASRSAPSTVCSHGE